MPQRFTIEEIEIQDTSGVIFRALDTETGGMVAVRRFFPFGPTGGGLTADEQEEYASALEHLETVKHPTLRSIVDGGCDPVDGIPFIATEWLNGVSLRHILASRPLSRAETTTVLLHALEACEALSTVLGREGVWIETDPQTIIIGAEETHRPVTFWISPLRWLGQLSGQKGMEPLVVLAEVAMGWSGDPADSHGTSGLAGWMKWLREAGGNVSLVEARERLVSSVGMDSGPTAHRPAQSTAQVTQTAAKKPKAKSKAPLWILASSILTAAGLAGWIVVHKKMERIADGSESPVPLVPMDQASPILRPRNASSPAIESLEAEAETAVSLSRPVLKTPEQASRAAAEGMARRQREDEEKSARQARISANGGILGVDDRDLLLEMKGSWVILEAILLDTRFSDSKKTFYLEFSRDAEKDGPLGVVLKKDFADEMTPEFFQQLIGKKIRIKGEAKNYRGRPEIAIRSRRDVEIEP